MIFLNWALALGALAFTVPLAIHLLFRNKFEMIDWGAMRFLESVVRVNRRRMQLRNLLLLLLRCAIPILLAFCLARPVITGWKTLPGDEPVSMTLAIDTSYSLAALVDPSTRRMDRLIATATEIVSALPRGSDVTLITSANVGGDGQGEAFQGNPQSTLTALQALKLGGPPLSLEALLSESLRRVSAGATERRQIVLLTDSAASDFSQSEISSLDSIGQRRQALAPAPSIAWVNAWDSIEESLSNRRVTRLEPSQSASVPGQTVSWSVEARIDGNEAVTTSVDIRVNGTLLQSKSLTFRGGLARVSFNTEFTTAGRHAVEVALPSEDGFASDDRLRADFLVLPSIDVWLVDGNPSDKPLQSDTDFLAIALSPFSLAGEKAVDLFNTSRVGVRQLASKKEETPDIVVLADVASVREDAAKWLRDFVENKAGTLVTFAGPSVEPDFWNQPLIAAESKPLLPMKWGDIKSSNENGTGKKIDEGLLTYPPLASFAREAKGTLAAVEVASYRVMTPHDQKVDSNVVMRLENGAPLIAVANVGSGRVMQIATTANDRWTSLPRRLAYVPLMQRLFIHLATGESRITTPAAGEPIVVAISPVPKVDKKKKSKDDLPSETNGERWNVTTPLGDTSQVTLSEGRLRFANTNVAGVYRFDSETNGVFYSAVNVPEADLKRTPLEPSMQSDVAKRMGATRYDSLSAYQSDDSTKRFGRGIWRYLLFALLAALVVEPFLQQRGAKVVA